MGIKFTNNKVCLVNPPVDPRVALGEIRAIYSFTKMVPLNLAYLGASLEKAGYPVLLVDAYAHDLSVDQVVDRIVSSRVKVCGISVVTPVIPIAQLIIEQLKARASDTKIVLGGAHPTAMPEETLMIPGVDAVVRGEGETTIVELCHAWREGRDISLIEGVSCKRNGKPFHAPDRTLIEDLDKISLPAYHLLDMSRYCAPPHWTIRRPARQMLASRGCPYSCIFCGIKALGKRFRNRSVENILEEVELLRTRYGVRQIQFIDPTFPNIRSIAYEFCDAFIREGYNRHLRWVTETRVNLMDEHLLNHMHKAGCRLVSYGVESGDDGILKLAKKGFSSAKAAEVIRMTRRAGMKVYSSFIFGLPGETLETIEKTIRFAVSNPINYPKFNIAVPYPGTGLYDMAVEQGQLKNLEWDKFTSFSSVTDYAPAYCPKTIRIEDLERLHKEAYRRAYFRPKMVLQQFGDFLLKRDPASYLASLRALVGMIRKSH